METCDVLIVGAGPAGSSCAGKLRRAGMDVLVLDRKAFPRDKPCAGWITPQVVQTIQLNVDDYRRRHVWQEITGFRCGAIGGRETSIHYAKPISYGIRRCEFDAYLLDRSGARCRLNQPVKTIERQRDRWIVNGQLASPLLVGAGGHFCPVARWLGAREQGQASLVVAQEVEFCIRPGQRHLVAVESQVPELFFCPDLRGYGWCFLKGEHLNIGLGRTDPRQLSSHVSQFCDFLRERRKVRCEISSRFVGHAYQIRDRAAPRLIAHGALLVGDAAGLAYPLSGEGIRPAVESGLIAAEAIRTADGRYGREDLTAYESLIESRFGKAHGRRASDWLPAALLRFLAAPLLAMPWFSRHVLMDRWFLHRHQPPLRL